MLLQLYWAGLPWRKLSDLSQDLLAEQQSLQLQMFWNRTLLVLIGLEHCAFQLRIKFKDLLEA